MGLFYSWSCEKKNLLNPFDGFLVWRIIAVPPQTLMSWFNEGFNGQTSGFGGVSPNFFFWVSIPGSLQRSTMSPGASTGHRNLCPRTLPSPGSQSCTRRKGQRNCRRWTAVIKMGYDRFLLHSKEKLRWNLKRVSTPDLLSQQVSVKQQIK